MFKISACWVLVTVAILYPSQTNGAERHQFNKSDGFQMPGSNSVSTVIKNKFILELEDFSFSFPKRSGPALSHGHVYASLKARGVDFTPDEEYHATGLFTGLSLTMHNAGEFTTLDSLPGVVSVSPAHAYRLPKLPAPMEMQASTVPYENYGMYVSTGVNKVHARNNTGAGVTVGIVDSGVDYLNPVLGSGIGPTHKVVGGYDFIGENVQLGGILPDEDPLDCHGSGTLYAGLIGANPSEDSAFKGIAYSASIRAYKIIDCYGESREEVAIQALLKAAEDKVDVLAAPGFGPLNGIWSPVLSKIFTRLAAAGVVVSTPAGDEGAYGPFLSLSSAASGVISTGSLDNDVIASSVAIVGGATHKPIPYSALELYNHPEPLPVLIVSPDGPECNLPNDLPEILAPFAVVIHFQAPCPDNDFFFKVVEKGPVYLLAYSDNDDKQYPPDVVINIPSADGEWLHSQVSAGIPVTLSFPSRSLGDGQPNVNGGIVSDFSGQGPTSDLRLSPSIIAPGTDIVSIYSRPLGGVASISGTGVASAFLVGCAALLLSVQNDTLVVNDVLPRLQSTTRKIPSSNENSALLETVMQQGAGLVNVERAIYGTTKLSGVELLLRDQGNFKDSHTFTITNNAKEMQNYKLQHKPAGTALTTTADTPRILQKPPLTQETMKATFSADNFPLLPGESKTITVKFSFPQNNNPKQNAVYSGFIEAVSNQDMVHAVYLALGSVLRTRKILDNQPGEFLIQEYWDHTTRDPLSQVPAFSDVFYWPFQGDFTYNMATRHYPIIVLSLLYSTSALYWELVDPNFKIPMSLNDNGNAEKNSPSQDGIFKPVGVVQVHHDVTRNSWMLPYNRTSYLSLYEPNFSNGTLIPLGTYRCLLRALKVGGDEANLEDYELWLSPGTITFKSVVFQPPTTPTPISSP